MSRLLKQLVGYPALIIDDLGYVQQSREEMEVLFTLLTERYERGSVLLTSNLPLSGWEAIFKDPMTTAAAIDRLVHHALILELNVPSYRAEQARKNRQGRAGTEGSNGSKPSTAVGGEAAGGGGETASPPTAASPPPPPKREK